MDFLELARERYSVRKFAPQKVEKEKLDAVLEAGRLAPTAVNYQPQRILVLDSDAALGKLKDCTPYHFSAPLALVVCYDAAVSWKRSYDGKDMGEVDASIVTTHMMLEAAAPDALRRTRPSEFTRLCHIPSSRIFIPIRAKYELSSLS